MYYMMTEQEFLDNYTNLTQELRRGILVLATLSQLQREKYGYALISSLAELGLEIDQGTLYPLLRRLELQGLVESKWRVENEIRPRRYYVISPFGKKALTQLKSEWSKLSSNLQKMLD
jgi:DNA-binding PadR family transcriptional regulator